MGDWIIFYGLIIFILGLCIGSFLNVVIYRLPKKLSVVWGRSFCPKCKKEIKWFDNVPLVSFILLKGHCRLCRSPISWQYPVVELATGGIFLLSYLSHLSFLSYILFAGLIAIFFIDLERQTIPDEIVFPLIFLFLIFLLITDRPSLIIDYLPSALLSFLFLYLIFLLTRGKGMGFGDVKLAFLMGLSLGFPKVVVAFYIAFLTGAFVGIILILVKKARFGQRIAFGPFLALSTIFTFLWGREILCLAQKLLF